MREYILGYEIIGDDVEIVRYNTIEEAEFLSLSWNLVKANSVQSAKKIFKRQNPIT